MALILYEMTRVVVGGIIQKLTCWAETEAKTERCKICHFWKVQLSMDLRAFYCSDGFMDRERERENIRGPFRQLFNYNNQSFQMVILLRIQTTILRPLGLIPR